MLAKVDGVDYNVSSNNITVDGLKITANKVDSSGSISTINIAEDNAFLNLLINFSELVAQPSKALTEYSSNISQAKLIDQLKGKACE